MPDQLQLRGGTTVQHSTFTGASKEVTVDTTKKTVVVHDGSTAGGNPMLREDASNSALALGSAGTPSLKFTGDTNTGIYSPGADQVAISTGGSGRLFINSAGNVGIGAANTGAAFLEVNGSLRWQTQGIFRNSTNTSTLLRFAEIGSRDVRLDTWDGTDFNGTIRHGAQTYLVETGTGASLTERLRITSAGLVGVGTSSPSTNTEINAALDTGASLALNEGQLSIGREANSGGAVRIGYDTTNNFGFISSGRVGVSWDKLILNAGGGNVGIGTSSVSSKLHIQDAHTLVADSQIALIENTTTGEPASLAFLAKADSGSTGNKGAIYFDAGADGATADNKLQFTAQHQDTITPAMTLDGSGRLGIGTTPSELLHVNGNALVRDRLLLQRLQASDNLSVLTFSDTLSGSKGNNLSIGNPGGFDLLFHTSGVEKARIDSSGRLLVGTSSTFSSGDFKAYFAGDSNSNSGGVIIGRFQNTSGGVPALELIKSRGASVGTNTVVQSGDELGTIRFKGADGTNYINAAEIRCDSDGTPGTNDMPGRLVFSVTQDGSASPTERARIRNAGNFNAFAPNDTFAAWNSNSAGTTYVNFLGVAGATGIANGSGTVNFVVYNNGNVQNTNNSYTAYSDIKLKENIVDAGSQWEDIKAFQIRKYNFKEETGHQTHTQIGLIAQEAELISPGLVCESPDRDAEGNDLGTVTKSVNYSVLYMKAVKALQEAMERIETLEAKVAALESA